MPYPHLSMRHTEQFQREEREYANSCVVETQMVPVLFPSVMDVNSNSRVKKLKGTAALFHILADSDYITELQQLVCAHKDHFIRYF